VFALTMALAGVWTRRTLTAHRNQQLAAQRVQVRHLAEAGVRRGAARLAADSGYDGEEWSVSSAELGLAEPAGVLIGVEPDGEVQRRYRITARARYPQEDHRVQYTKTVTFSSPNTESEP
jgi:hypothetical protein